MSAWHREHPELAGTEADPWMHIPSYRAAHDELVSYGVIDPPDDGALAAGQPDVPADDEPPADADAMMPHIFGEEN